MSIIKMSDINITEKRVLIRLDLNIPLKDGVIMDSTRIHASLPVIKMALESNAQVMIMSHLGRPTEGVYRDCYSLAPVAHYLSTLLDKTVRLEKHWLNFDSITIKRGEVVLFENVRFNCGEKSNDDKLAQQMASLCDIYIMDAFGTAHRAHASTHGIAKYAPIACAGPLLIDELDALNNALDDPSRPMVAIVGGSKVSTKLIVLKSLLKIVDELIVGGGIANTFIAADGNNIGNSLYESDLLSTCEKLAADARSYGGSIPVPTDVICGKEFSESAQAVLKSTQDVENDDIILDIGPRSIAKLTKTIKNAGTIIWNGPIGVFEFDQFAEGTRKVAMAVAESKAFSIAGGGDTIAAVTKYNISDNISYISTGGGAFLEFLEGKELPAISMLKSRTK